MRLPELFVLLSLGLVFVYGANPAPLAPEKAVPAATSDTATHANNLRSNSADEPGYSRLSIAAWVGIGCIVVFIIVFSVTMVYKGRNSLGLPNTIRGEVGKISGLPSAVDVYVVVSSMGEMCHRTEFKLRPGDAVTFDEPFVWSVSPQSLSSFKQTGKVKFEVFNMKGTGYAITDPTLGAVEIPISELYVEGQIEKMEGLRLRTKKGIVINVKVGVFAEHFFFQSFNRFLQSWRLRQREVSFWTRVLSIPLSAALILLGLVYLDTNGLRTMGITDAAVGAVIGATLIPHLLHWLGMTFLDAVKMDSLLSASSLYLSCTSVMIAIWRYFGPINPIDCGGHFALIGCVGLGSLLFLVGDLKGEPGASCLGRAIGSAFSAIFGCCCGGSKAAMLRHAI